jgi:hypothetical protein
MGRRPAGGMHIDRVRSRHTVSSGETRHYESSLLRRSYRKPDGKVGKQTLANLSMLPAAAVDAIDAVLKGKTLVEADAALQVSRSLPHGHVALVHAMATRLGLPALLGPACRERDLAYALVLSRVVHPKSKLATLSWWNDTTLGADLGVIGASRNEVYAAMDWLLGRQDAIEAGLSGRHLVEGGVAMFDLSSSWVEGRCCELAARGYSRDAKKGTLQIEYGLLTDPEGRPVAIRVFPGNTADPTAFTEAVQLVRDKFRLSRLTLIGDRGMITSARIEALREGPLQLSLFDQQDLAEITHPDYPGERLIACRNPHLATERARKREALLDATETLLAPLVTAVADGRLAGAGQIGIKTGKLINKFKMAKHFDVTITDTSLTITRRQAQITAEAALDGIYVLRTPVPATTLDAPATVAAYKSLSHVEADFRSLKTIDADLHPIHHYLSDRVRAHVLICMLACYLTWHLRHALAELTYTHPRAITPSPPPPDPPTPRVRPAATTTTPASPCTTSAACSNTWPP